MANMTFGVNIIPKDDTVSLGTSLNKWKINGVDDPKLTDTTYSNATTSAAGLMSTTDKTKLDGIASGAQVNTITGVKGNSESAYRTGNVNLTAANVGAKATQAAVSDPAASGTAAAFIDSISQNAQGVITATKKTVTRQEIGFYTSVTQLGLTSGTATISAVFNALSNGQRIESKSDEYSSSEVPGTQGCVVIDKSIQKERAYILFYGKTNAYQDYRMFLTSGGAPDGTWVKLTTGVKGDAESSYRTGNVNITPANIGAVALNGSTKMTGQLTIQPAGSEGGQILLAAPSDHPERAGINIDQQSTSNLRIFGQPSADGTSITGAGTTLTINPYAKTITGGYTFTGNVTGNCSGSSGSCTGNAATATKATQDGNGSNIASTYLKLSGGTMTGALKWGSGTALSAASSLQYFLGIDAFADGGTTHYISASNLRNAIGAVNKAGDTMTGTLSVNRTNDGNEARVQVESTAGTIYLYSAGSKTGNRGIYTSNAVGTGKGVITIDQNNNITFNGNAVNVTGTVQVDHGGTGATTAAAARTNLGAAAASEVTHQYIDTGSISLPLDTSGYYVSFETVGKNVYITFRGMSRAHTEDEVFMVIPEGYRSGGDRYFPAAINNVACGVVMRSNGNVSIYTTNPPSGRIYLSMSYCIE